MAFGSVTNKPVNAKRKILISTDIACLISKHFVYSVFSPLGNKAFLYKNY